MANYIKATNFTAKDALPTGNAGKIIKGTEIDVEYTAIATAIASKADTNSPTFTGSPTAPTAAVGTNNTQIATTAFVGASASAAIPAGTIVAWAGTAAQVPAGWAVCDGTNGTPNLQDRFIIGAGSSYAVNSANSLSAKDAVVPAHTHTFSATTSTIGNHAHNIGYTNGSSGDAGAGVPLADFSSTGSTNFTTTNAGAHNHTVSGTTASAGVSATNANLPPYVALLFIMKL
jgi:hypothetical protein